ncbi:hypothetical protein WJX84_011159 [Apatococcus fuscideae]|uniref:Hemicentin-1-like von Willebrand factor A domain-containing protein n=1 Tax=Apatococcus fuscideae TaxID=2026836 RepID=A0AAW1T4A8_9CHLO
MSKGLDVAILMDMTGSMDEFVEAVRTKAAEIIASANDIHPQAVIRLALVGYRDYDDNLRSHVEFIDFVEKEDFGALKDFMEHLVAKGGDDWAEDIAGGLQAVGQLTWKSSTRLVVHFVDYPAHGRKYQEDRAHGDEQYDRFPDGDPSGLLLEQLIQNLASNAIDYHMVELTGETDVMAKTFEDGSAGSNRAFQTIARAGVNGVVPLQNGTSGSRVALADMTQCLALLGQD